MFPLRNAIMFVGIIAVAPLCAHGADTLAEMAKLFDLGALNTPPAVKSAREAAVRIKRANMQDMRIDYAYGLVLANQRRYDEAIRLIGHYLKTQPRELAAREVTIWAKMQNKQYADLLDTAIALGKQLQLAKGAAPQGQNLQMAEVLGTVFGYLELVQPDAVNQKDLAVQKNAMMVRLPKVYLSAFDRGRAAVVPRSH